ncbi:MAG: YigZ family protein [Eubacterium sp.]
MNEYKTVEKEACDEFIEKKSKFIGYVKPVKTVQEATDFINSIKSKHWDATHNVSAFVLRENNIQRSSDDGEPSGTAGVPVLDVLLKEGLYDVCVVVTRYFGGILLGAGGLVRAYSHGSKLAVNAGNIITMAPCKLLSVTVDYSFYERLLLMLNDTGANVEDSNFADFVTVNFSLKSDLTEKFSNMLTEQSNGRYSVKELGEKFAKV